MRSERDSIEQWPRLGIILPHPTQPDTCAVSANTNTIPGVRIDADGLTDEQIARRLGRVVNADSGHSVDKSARVAPSITLYLMKPARYPELTPGHRWQQYDPEHIREAIRAVVSPQARQWPQTRYELAHEYAMCAVGVRTLVDSLSTPNQEETVRSYFFEVRGAYGLPQLSEI